MLRNDSNPLNKLLVMCLILITAGGWPGLAMGKDTDIYEVSTKQNCYVLIDNSASMGFGVYEENIDYGDMFDYLFTLNDSGSYNDYIYDTVNYSDYFYQNHQETRKIYLWKGQIGVTITNVDGEDISFTGDAADPDYLWYMGNLVDTHTLIDSSGNLSGDGVGTQRLTTDADGHVLFDGQRLPIDRDIKLTDWVTLYDGSLINNGFGGLLNAPGYYFSGYEGVTSGNLDVAEDGDQNIYFFVSGNWINMQAMYNLHYTTNNPDPTGASNGDAAWKFETFPISSEDWSELAQTVRYPDTGNYSNNLSENTTSQTITHPGAAQIQVHFSSFDVEGNNNVHNWNYDFVAIYNGSGDLVAKYDNDNPPTDGDGWSDTINDETVEITLKSDNSVTGTGYIIDKIRVTYAQDAYLMQDRLDVAKDALLYVLDTFYGKINWGYATYQYTGGGSGDGATINSALNPNLTDDANRAAIQNHVENTSISNGGTPLGEALQDVFEDGYWGHRNSLNNLLCRKNYVISVTDGYPSDDNEWDRISDVNGDAALPFEDWDGDGWTEDPYQYADPPDDYYDDVGHWMYTHSWDDKTEVTDPADSYVNVITHHVAFGMDHPLLKDAAGESGGLYVAAYNKTQLVAAFYSLALQMTEAISFTAPVVSVDASNKILNGDDLYLGLFLPQDNQSWFGNLKKFKFGDGSTDRPDIWMLYDGANQEAINGDGEFSDNTAAFWADDWDDSDSDDYGSADVKEDGVGEVMTEQLAADFAAGNYWERPIYTYDAASDSLVHIRYDTMSASDLNVADDLTRDKVINYLYGYTYDADAATHAPSATRDWAMGAIVHSRPVIIDYFDSVSNTTLLHRYIAVSGNDGMVHIFDDDDGTELFSFVPTDLLPNLQLLPDNPDMAMVDGELVLYKRDSAPKYLIFGERRGGSAFWCLDVSDTNPLNWTVAWGYSNSEIAESWSAPVVGSIPVDVNSSTGKREYKDVVIITGGYDSEEDDYPEPFNDADNNGTPILDNGNIDNDEWDQNNSSQDVYDNNDYDLYNPDMDDYGRGIWVLDIDDPDNEVTDSLGNTVLPFSVTYGASDVTTGAEQNLSDMKFCFPASPATVTLLDSYIYKNGGGELTEDKHANVVKVIYAIDIYANVYKINYDFDVTPDDPNAGSYSASGEWRVTRIFSGNPGSSSDSGTFGQGVDTSDQGRKVFYPPAVSWGGSCKYLDASNYQFADIEFSGLNELATLFFGTGDREHPTYTMIRNRYYSIYDDSSVTATDVNTLADVAVSTVPYSENDLMNLTCNELDDGTTLTSGSKETIMEGLTDDATYDNGGTLQVEDGTHEDDAKGWYIILADQDDSSVCSHCSYAAALSTDHTGEKVLSASNLFSGVVYFTSYQPWVTDPCNPEGNGFIYSLSYCDGCSVYGDRYIEETDIPGIPSEVGIVTTTGGPGGTAMMGGKMVGPKGGGDYTINGPGYGLELFYWRGSDSQK